MKRSSIIALLVFTVTAAFASTAAALNGHVHVGGGTHDFTEMFYWVGGELKVNDRLAVSALMFDPHREWGHTGLEVRYGRGSGVYAGTYFFDGKVNDFYTGFFFEHAFSDSFQISTYLGVFMTTNPDEYNFVIPEAWVSIRYDLAGPFALLANIEDWAAGMALAYEF